MHDPLQESLLLTKINKYSLILIKLCNFPLVGIINIKLIQEFGDI
jgi:hypothetical protein